MAHQHYDSIPNAGDDAFRLSELRREAAHLAIVIDSMENAPFIRYLDSDIENKCEVLAGVNRLIAIYEKRLRARVVFETA